MEAGEKMKNREEDIKSTDGENAWLWLVGERNVSLSKGLVFCLWSLI